MKKITVVIDMQNDFLIGSLPNRDAVSIIPSILHEIKKSDFVIYTRDTHGSDYFETQEGKKLPIKHCIKDTWGWEIVEELNPQTLVTNNIMAGKRWYILDKPSFGYVNIWNGIVGNFPDLILNNEDIEVTFCGTCTDICVISNALIVKSLYPELVVNVKADACAGLTQEKHKAALDVMSSCQINIIKKTKL
jgi:nicotinamidase-related amidase